MEHRNTPLLGQQVMITRPVSQGDPLKRRLVDLGAQVLVQPAITIAPPDDWQVVDAVLENLDSYDWLVFSSIHGVQGVLNRLQTIGRGLPLHLKLAAIGPGTADALLGYGLHTDLIPEEYRAESLAEALVCVAGSQRFLLARTSRGREVLAEQLLAAGNQVTQIVVYESLDVKQADPEIQTRLRAGQIDWTTVTSSAIARSLVRLFGQELRQTRLASISPITSNTLRELGYPQSVEATAYTMDGVVDALVREAMKIS